MKTQQYSHLADIPIRVYSPGAGAGATDQAAADTKLGLLLCQHRSIRLL
jgi:hypothetical protein